MKTILITGGSGLVGRALSKKLIDRGYQIIWLSRNQVLNAVIPSYYWNYEKNEIDNEALKKADIIVHLAGESIGSGWWTKEKKKTIIDSRVKTTNLLSDSLKKLNKKPEAFISASAVGIYGNEITDNIYTENEKQVFPDFLAQVCNKWEDAVDRLVDKTDCRVVKIRTSMVLSHESQAFKKMYLPIKLGVGSPIGSGKQYVSWIHIDDLCEIYIKAIEDSTMSSVYNAVAPEQITNKGFMKVFATVMSKPFFFPNIPSFIMRLIMGESADLVLGGSRISNKKLIDSNFIFKHQQVESALRACLHQMNDEKK